MSTDLHNRQLAKDLQERDTKIRETDLMGHGSKHERIAMEVQGWEWDGRWAVRYLYVLTVRSPPATIKGKKAMGGYWARAQPGAWIRDLDYPSLTSQQESFLGIFDISYLHVRC